MFKPKFAVTLVVLVVCLNSWNKVYGKPSFDSEQDNEAYTESKEIEQSVEEGTQETCPKLTFGCEDGSCWSRCIVERTTLSPRATTPKPLYSEFRTSTNCDSDDQCEEWANGKSFRSNGYF